MDKAIHLEIVTPDKVVLSKQAAYVSVPGVAGIFGVLPNHAPLLAGLDIGCLSYDDEDKEKHYLFVGGGFTEVSNNKITVLAESAEPAEDIDESRALEAKHRAETRLKEKIDFVDLDRAQAALKRSIARLAVFHLRH